MHVVIFEGSRWPTFAPVSLSRPVFSLASGMSTLLNKQLRYLEPTKLTLWVRSGLVEYCRRHVVPNLKVPTEINAPLGDEPALLVSGRTLHFGKYEMPREPGVMTDNDGICSAYVISPGLTQRDAMSRSDAWMKLFELPKMKSQGRMAGYLWDLISWNEESLVDDAINLKLHCGADKPKGPYHLVNDEEVCLGREVKLAPGCVLDASNGVVMIDQGASIGANAVVQGPCYIGPHSQVMPLGHVRPGTTVGSICKVGGEIGNSILMSYTNKPHTGYVGDSYVGEWVNFGAGSTTSNLKNTYSEIEIRIGAQAIPSGRRFLGSLVGDHTKLAIGTRLMTGSYIGHCCMVAMSGLPPTSIRSFTFLTDKGAVKYDRAKAKEMIQSTYGRRGREWQAADDEVLDYVEETAGQVEGSI